MPITVPFSETDQIALAKRRQKRSGKLAMEWSMKAIFNLLVRDKSGVTPIDCAFLAAGISIVILFGLLLLEG